MTYHSDNTIFVLFGNSSLPVYKRRKLLKEYGLSNCLVSTSIGTEPGVEVQEFLNHKTVHNICIISDAEDIRPLEDYRIRPNTFLLYRAVKKMLEQPYHNKMAKQNSSSKRNQF